MDDDGASMNGLIEIVRQYKAIYDTKSKKYKDQAIRTAVWAEIGEKLKLPPDKCKDAWTKLRNSYVNAMKRRRKNKQSEKATVVPPWKYEDQMSFLQPYVIPRVTKTVITLPLPEFLPNEETSRPPSENSQEPIYFDEPQTNSRSVTPQSDSSLQSHISVDYLHNAINTSQDIRLQRRFSKLHEMDETDLFFLSMSKALKRLPKLDQSKIKLNLHKAISEAEIRELENQAGRH